MLYLAGILLITYVSATPGQLLLEITPAGPIGHLLRGYGKAVVLIAFAGFLLIAARGLPRRLSLVVFGLLSSALIYVALDWVHVESELSFFQFAKEVFYNKVTSSYLTAVSVFGLLVILEAKWDRNIALRTVVITPTIFAAISLIVWVVIETGLYSFGHYGVTNNNVQAYESIGILAILLFLAAPVLTQASALAIVGIHGLVPFVHRSRGGMLVMLCVIAGYLFLAARERGWHTVFLGPVHKMLFAVSLLLALGLVGVVQPTIGVSPRISDLNTTQAQDEQWAMTIIARHLTKIMSSSEYRHNLISNNLISRRDNVVSAYGRLGTTLIAVKAYVRNPIGGIGIWNAYREIEVANIGIHGLLPLLMAAYGTLGLIPLAVLIGPFCAGHRIGQVVKVELLAMILMIIMLVNFYPSWLGFLLWAFATPSALFPVERTAPARAREIAQDAESNYVDAVVR